MTDYDGTYQKDADFGCEIDDPVARTLFGQSDHDRIMEWQSADQNSRRNICLADLRASVGRRYQDVSLDNYEFYHPNQRSMVAQLRTIIPNLAERTAKGQGLVWFGQIGTGKDHMMAAMLLEAAKRAISCRFISGMEIQQKIRDAMDDHTPEREVQATWLEPAILAISDPSPPVGSLTDFQVQKLYQILDRRYRQSRPTWATLNALNIDQVDSKLTAPIFDRLRDGADVFECKWQSYRERRK